MSGILSVQAPGPRTPGPTVLVVEDDADLLAALAFDLESYGFSVLAFAGGHGLHHQALAAQCLIVDYHLPDTDGISLIVRLRNDGLSAPAILITTTPDANCRARASAVGALIVEKPLIGGNLRQAIGMVLPRR